MDKKDVFNPDGSVIESYRLEFYKFALDIYNGVIQRETPAGKDLMNYGFCAMFYTYFCTTPPSSIELALPELYVYKPTLFYDCEGNRTDERDQFWFPIKHFDPKGEQVRIKILSDIIINFK